MHKFDIRQVVQGITVLFCKRCGLSYNMIQYSTTEEEPGKTVWERIEFQDYQGKDIDQPCKPCSNEGYSE